MSFHLKCDSKTILDHINLTSAANSKSTFETATTRHATTTQRPRRKDRQGQGNVVKRFEVRYVRLISRKNRFSGRKSLVVPNGVGSAHIHKKCKQLQSAEFASKMHVGNARAHTHTHTHTHTFPRMHVGSLLCLIVLFRSFFFTFGVFHLWFVQEKQKQRYTPTNEEKQSPQV